MCIVQYCKNDLKDVYHQYGKIGGDMSILYLFINRFRGKSCHVINFKFMQFYVTTDSSILSSVKRMSRPGSSFAKRTVL